MRTQNRFARKAVLLACLGLALPAAGAGESMPEDQDKTLSPYFFVKSDQSQVDQLPLKSTRAEVAISGAIADVQVTQVYRNEGKNILEAVYIFPASTRAAVYAMKMTVGERTIVADIREKQKAREEYEQALSQGRTASLLEQQRPNVFQMNVGNILPGDEIKVVLNYTEALVPRDCVYEFVYPAVVGPRYSNQPASAAPASETWVANPYLHSGEEAPFTFGFDLTLQSGMPIARITSPSHDLDIAYTGRQAAHAGLKDSTTHGNRDVVVRYTLAGDHIESGLLLHQGGKENFFLLMLEPPKRVETAMIVPREYIFVVDVSGSMHGFPLDVTKALMKDLLGGLRPSDCFNVMLFAGGNSVLAGRSLPATRANLQKALDLIDRQQGGGGTELMPALRAAMALPRAGDNISRSLVVVTDGYVSVEKDAFEYIRAHLNRGNVFSFGIGSSVNRYLIEGLARAGMGEPFVILNQNQAQARAREFKEYIESPVLTDIRVEFSGFKVSDVEPASIADLFAGKPVMLFGKYTGAAGGRAIITGKTAGKPYRREIEISGRGAAADNQALRYLWARHRIMTLADLNRLDPGDRKVKEVTRLGLEYSLLTEYTSFVAVDSVKRADGTSRVTVRQPLPMPQGVSDYAVGGAARSLACAPAACCKKERRGGLGTGGFAGQAGPAAFEAADLAEEKTAGPVQDAEPVGVACRITVQKGRVKPAEAEKMLAALKKALREEIRAGSRTGMLAVRLHIDARGRVARVEVVKDTLGMQTLLAKINREAGNITFPPDRQGAIISMTIEAN